MKHSHSQNWKQMPDETPSTDQTSLSIGGGRPPSLLTNFRTGTAAEQVESILEVGLAQIPAVRQLEAEWFASAPEGQQQQQPKTTSYNQGVANAQAGLTNQSRPAPSTTPQSNGDAHPTKKCKDCGSDMQYKVWAKKDDPNKKYRKLECVANPREHAQEWAGWV
ncbi:MAG: hypothetical protein KGL35_19170 [Bradyrhizobium sp.]|nr:hypothetical protein [Bradyrhizobium sp.]